MRDHLAQLRRYTAPETACEHYWKVERLFEKVLHAAGPENESSGGEQRHTIGSKHTLYHL